MNGIGAIKTALEGTAFVLKMYVEDLSDADLFVRPVPAANHAAWQIGQVIVGDAMLVKEQLPDAKYPELPPGSKELYGKEGAKKDGPEGFLTKAEYVALFDSVRSATIAALETLTDRPRPAHHGRHRVVRPDAGSRARRSSAQLGEQGVRLVKNPSAIALRPFHRSSGSRRSSAADERRRSWPLSPGRVDASGLGGVGIGRSSSGQARY